MRTVANPLAGGNGTQSRRVRALAFTPGGGDEVLFSAVPDPLRWPLRHICPPRPAADQAPFDRPRSEPKVRP